MRRDHYDRHYKMTGEEFTSLGDTKHRASADFGDIFSDAAGAVEDVGSSIVDKVGDIIPGPLKDAFSKFADTGIGHVVLFVASGGAYSALVPALGPQLAAVAFALPGMAKGDNFMKAWMEGFVERVTLLIKYFISTGIPQDQAADMAAQATQSDMDKAQKYVDQIGGVAKLAGMDFQTLAAKAGIREDMAAEYLANANGNLSLPQSYKWDPATGKSLGPAILSTKDKIRLIQASVDPTKATTTKQKLTAIKNIGILAAQHHKPPHTSAAKKAVYTTVGAGAGVGLALAVGASAPIAAGAAALLGLLALLSTEGGSN